MRFRNNFQDYLNPLYPCSLDIEDTSHYILHRHHFLYHPVVLVNSVKFIRDHFDSIPDNVKEGLLLYGDSRFDENKNKIILKATINYIKKLKNSRDPFLINVSLLNNVQILTYNSGHSIVTIFHVNYRYNLAFLNLDFSPTVQYIVDRALLHVFFVCFISCNHHHYRKKKVRPHLGGIIFLQAVPPRQDCLFNLDSVCFYNYYLKKCNSSYKI